MMRPARKDRGFTFIEAMVAVSVLLLLLVSFTRVFVTTSGLSADTRALMRAQEDNRRSLNTLGNALRGAAWSSLSGFASDGTSTAPTFRKPTGAGAFGITLDAAETLSWRAKSGLVNGVASPGEVIDTKNGIATVVAPRVPSGGFKVIQVGNALRVQLTTYCSSSLRKVATATSEIEISLRN